MDIIAYDSSIEDESIAEIMFKGMDEENIVILKGVVSMVVGVMVKDKEFELLWVCMYGKMFMFKFY